MKPLSQDQMAAYRRTALAREKERQQANAARRMAAMEVARHAAALLKREFCATRVVVYGSTAHGYWFNRESDIDLAAEGIPLEKFWRAWNAIDAIDPDFEVNLVAWEDASPALMASIEREGIAL